MRSAETHEHYPSLPDDATRTVAFFGALLAREELYQLKSPSG